MDPGVANRKPDVRVGGVGLDGRGAVTRGPGYLRGRPRALTEDVPDRD